MATLKKPISRILCSHVLRFKLPSFISFRRRRRNLATYPPGSGERPSIPGLHGLAIREVFLLCLSLGKAVSSYLTLFTLTLSLPKERKGGIVSVALSITPIS